MQRTAFALTVLLNLVITSSLLAGSYYAVVTGIVPLPAQQVQHAPTQRSAAPSSPAISATPVSAPTGDPIVDTVARVSPSVVSIVITRDLPKLRPMRTFRFDPFSGGIVFDSPEETESEDAPTEKQKVGGGSGFFISADGMILTNKHVVNYTDADYTVVTNDGTELPAKVLARDPNNDLAILKVDGKDFPALPLGDSSSVKIGQTVIAIGNALGEYQNTVSVGVVSGLSRTITAGGSGLVEQLEGVIQTDAAINPGNSGGPLLNVSGEVVGINTAVAQSAQSIGFALAINDAKRDIESVQKHGRIVRAYLGVRYSLITEEIQKENNLPVDYGAIIIRGDKATELAVVPGSPADKAGLLENDIITMIDGKKVTSEQPLWKLIAGKNVGDMVELTVLSKGEEKRVQLQLEEAPDPSAPAPKK